MGTGTQIAGGELKEPHGGDVAVTEKPVLIELRLPRRFWTRKRLAAPAIFVLLMLIALIRLGNSPSNDPRVMLLVAVPIVLVYVYCGRSQLTNTPGVVEQKPLPADIQAGPEARVRCVVPIEQWYRRPKRAARMLNQAGITGLALRLSSQREQEREPVQVLLVPFEPLPLDEAAEETGALTGESSGVAGGGAKSYGQRVNDWSDFIQRHGQLEWLGMLGFGFVVSHCACEWWLGRTPIWVDVIWLVVISIGVVASVVNLARGTSLYIVPGGLVDVRRRRAYLRSEGVLLWYPETDTLLVTDGEEVFEPAVTKKEALLAVRAWLSPMPVPTDEMIVAFLLGRS